MPDTKRRIRLPCCSSGPGFDVHSSSQMLCWGVHDSADIAEPPKVLQQAIERRLRQHMEDEDAAPGLDAAGSSAINGPATAEPLANGHREEVMSDSGGSKARAEGQASTMENGLRQPLLRAAEQSDP